MYKIVLFFVFLALPLFSEPMKATKLGDYFKTQYAGYIGFLSVGVGEYSFEKKLESEFFYGYAPQYISTVEIHTLTIKNNFVPVRFKSKKDEIAPYLGLGVMYMPKQRYMANAREHVPSNYYHITGIHGLIYAGISYKHEFKETPKESRAISFYLEIGTIDGYLVSYASNPNYLSPEDIYSLAIGVGYHY